MRERYRAGPIRIGVHGAPLSGTKSGIGRYVFELCQQLDRLLPDAEFFVYSQTPPSSPLPSNRWHLRLASGASRRLSGYGWLKFASRGLIRKDRLDAFWATRTLLPPLDRTTGSVSTVYDLNHILVPETMNTVNRVAHSLWLRRDVLNSDQVISISAGTAMRLEKHFGRVSDAIASPGTDERYRAASEIQIEEVLSRHGIAKPYLLAVGTLEPRKNLATLVHAFLALRQARELEFHTLVLAGPGGWKQSELSRDLAIGVSGVTTLGYVPEADLPALYSGCDLFVMPSLYEGYGMPAAEARACGVRILASDFPELREAGGPHARYVPPTKESLMEGLRAALDDPRPPPERSSCWDESARTLADALLRAAAIGIGRAERPSA